MANKIQIKRGNFTNLPLLDIGELALVKDKNRVYYGNYKNQRLANFDDFETTMHEDYISLIGTEIKNYSYDNMISDIEKIVSKYGQYVKKEIIGKSYLNRDIVSLQLGNINGKNKLLVFSGHHAREQHMASIILKQIEYYCENLNSKYKNETLEDILKNSCIHFIPSINPDGLEICRIGINSIPSSNTTLINKIKSAIEYKIKNTLSIGQDLTQAEYDELMVRCNNNLQNYVFDNKDCKMWKANANGVDLHYNSWETGINEDVIKKWQSDNSHPSSFASQDYIGTVGMGEVENVALKNYINKYNLWSYTISYHGKGPTCFWNYKLKSTQLRRNYKITTDLSNISKTPYSEQINGYVGFSGYIYAKTGIEEYTTYSSIRETGLGREQLNKDNNYVVSTAPETVCPLDNWQQPYLWETEKNIPLHMLKIYCRRQDIIERETSINDYEINGKYSSANGFYSLPTSGNLNFIFKWGTTTVTFTNNQSVIVTIPYDTPFENANFGAFANCFNNLSDNKFSINCSKDLNQIVIRVYSPNTLNGTFNINWFSFGA